MTYKTCVFVQTSIQVNWYYSKDIFCGIYFGVNLIRSFWWLRLILPVNTNQSGPWWYLWLKCRLAPQMPASSQLLAKPFSILQVSKPQAYQAWRQLFSSRSSKTPPSQSDSFPQWRMPNIFWLAPQNDSSCPALLDWLWDHASQSSTLLNLNILRVRCKMIWSKYIAQAYNLLIWSNLGVIIVIS